MLKKLKKMFGPQPPEVPTYVGAWRRYFAPEYEPKIKKFEPIEEALEITPTFLRADDTSILAALPLENIPRTLELIKEGNKARIILVADDTAVNIYRACYPDLRITKTTKTTPAWFKKISNNSPVTVLDVEYFHSLPFGTHTVPADWVDGVLATMPPDSWVQVVYQRWDWSLYAELTAFAIERYQKSIEQGIQHIYGSTPYSPENQASPLMQAAPELTKTFLQRSHNAICIIVHVRAMVLGGANTQSLSSALGRIKVQTDQLVVLDNSDPAALSWFTRRVMVLPRIELEILATKTFGTFGVAPWGRGRELIPCLTMSAEELPNMVRLPQAPPLRELFEEEKTKLILGERT